jgi:hypothetical protein
MEKQQKIEKKLREAERIVTELLTEYPITRDDDRLLVWLFWRKQFERIDNYSLEMFRSAFLGGMLSPPETITRARRKVQEKRPELRGIASNSRADLAEIYSRYYGSNKAIQQDLFSGRFRDMAIAGSMYDQVIGKGGEYES